MSCHQQYPWNPDFYYSQSFQEDLGFLYHAPLPTGEFLNHCTFLGICYNSTPPPGTNTCICFQCCKTISNKLSNLTHINYLIVSVGQNSGHDLAESSVQGPIRPLCSSRGSTGEETTSRFTFIAVWRIVSYRSDILKSLPFTIGYKQVTGDYAGCEYQVSIIGGHLSVYPPHSGNEHSRFGTFTSKGSIDWTLDMHAKLLKCINEIRWIDGREE